MQFCISSKVWLYVCSSLIEKEGGFFEYWVPANVPARRGGGETALCIFMYRRPTLYPLEIAVDFLKSP